MACDSILTSHIFVALNQDAAAQIFYMLHLFLYVYYAKHRS